MAEEDRKAMVSPSAQEGKSRKQKERLSGGMVRGREKGYKGSVVGELLGLGSLEEALVWQESAEGGLELEGKGATRKPSLTLLDQIILYVSDRNVILNQM